MGYERIGFANRNADGTWSPVYATDAKARRAARDGAVNRATIATPVFVDVPATPPRPVVVLATNGERVRWNAVRDVYVLGGVDVPTLVGVIAAAAVLDAELDALQALPALTAAWVAAGGRD
jgi:hypothetical protein